MANYLSGLLVQGTFGVSSDCVVGQPAFGAGDTIGGSVFVSVPEVQSPEVIAAIRHFYCEDVLLHGSAEVTTQYGLLIGNLTSANENWGIYCIPNSYFGTNVVIAGFNGFGTGAHGVLAFGPGTAPSTSPADTVQIWAADRASTAGKGSLHIRTEDGTSHVLGDRVGIGTTSPSVKFSSKASAANDGATGNNADGAIWSVASAGWCFAIENTSTATAANGLLIRTTGSTVNQVPLKICAGAGNTNILLVHADGSIVVGSPTGGAKGAGTINAQAVYDDNTLLADYILEMYHEGDTPDAPHPNKPKGVHRLLNIRETRLHTQIFKHLPGMPSREDWDKDPLSLGGFAGKILEAVERVQLHVYELEAVNEQLQEQINQLKGTNNVP